MRNIIVSFILSVGLATCSAAPAYTQDCLEPDTLLEMVNADIILQGLPPLASTIDRRVIDNQNVTIYWDGSVGLFVVVPFDFNWCANGDPIFLTPDAAKEMLDVEVPV
jgi:hypothetical protein